MADSFSEGQKAFYHTYGMAMALWAEIEADLGDHFERISKMRSPIARAVYYSARSFQGRADMLSACIPFARTIPDGRHFLTRAVSTARSWAAARNRLAHDMHFLDIWSNESGAITLPPLQVLRSPSGETTTELGVRNAASNFFLFAEILRASMGQQKLLREPELCLELLHQLTTDPLAVAADRIRAEPLLERVMLSQD